MGDDTANGINGFDYLAGYQSQNIYSLDKTMQAQQ